MEIQLFISGVPPKQTVDISEGKFLASLLLLISHKISFNFIQKQKYSLCNSNQDTKVNYLFQSKKKNNNATGSLSGSEVKILCHSNIRNITVIVELTRTTE